MESASRFAHLLQPIKDMSKIWNIPIAEELETYLSELEALALLDPEESVSKMNFAEAALLIQGSTNIYGRKVELLYELAYHALDLIVSDRKDDKGPKRKGAASSGLWGPIPDEMETVDHLIKEGRGIEMDEGSMTSSRVSAMRRVPLWLMPREATDRRRHEFRITSCAVHRTGCHLLQESDAHVLDKLLAENRVQRDGTEPLAPTPPRVVNELDEELQALLCQLPPDQRVDFKDGSGEGGELVKPEDKIEDGPEPDVPLEEEMDMDGFPETPPSTPPPQDDAAPKTPILATPRVSMSLHDLGVPLAPGASGGSGLGGDGKPVVQANPWELLDEHDASGKENKMQVGKCWKKPSDRLLVSLDQLPDPDQMMILSDEARWQSDACGAASVSVGGHPVEALFKAMGIQHNSTARCEAHRLGFSGVWLEGEDLLADAMRQRATQRRQRAAQERLEMKARARVGASGASPGKTPGKRGSVGIVCSDSSDTEEEQNPKVGTPGGTPAKTPGATPGGTPAGTPSKTPGKPGEEEEEDKRPKGPTVDDLLVVEQRKEVARLEGAIEAAQRKYEATIREYLEKNNRSLLESSSAKRMPELYANVRAWQDMLEPVLKEQHKRPDFDIFNYGQDLLVAMGVEKGPPVPFYQLVSGVPRWEVCRRFLTCLVLTNHGNTDIVVQKEQDRLNAFSLQLINAKKELPSLQDDPDAKKKELKEKGKKGAKPLADLTEQQSQEPMMAIAADDAALPIKAPVQQETRGRKKARVGKEN